MRLFESIQFWGSNLRHPFRVAALFPTHKDVAETIASYVQTDMRCIVEFGASTGKPLTEMLVENMHTDAHLHAFEYAKKPRKILKQRFEKNERVHCYGDLFAAPENLYGNVDLLVSTVPMSTMKKEMREGYFGLVDKLLTPDSTYIHLQYSPKAIKIIEEQLDSGFGIHSTIFDEKIGYRRPSYFVHTPKAVVAKRKVA